MPHQCTNCGRTFPDGSKEMLSGCPDCGGNKFQFAPAAETEAADSPEEGADATGETADSSAATADPTTAASDGVNSSADADEPTSTRSGGVTSRAAETVRDWVSTGSAETERSWPSAETDQESPPEEFEEWPETARPPADRAPDEERAAESTPPRSTTRADAAASPADSRVRDADSDDAANGAAIDSPDDAASDSVTADSSEPAEADVESSGPADGEDSAQASARSEIVSPEELPATDDRPPEHGRVVSEPSGEEQSLEDLREELNDQFESIKIVSPGQYELNLMELYDREEYIVSLQEDGRYVIDVPDSWREGDE